MGFAFAEGIQERNTRMEQCGMAASVPDGQPDGSHQTAAVMDGFMVQKEGKSMDGIEFLMEYRAHPDQYRPMVSDQLTICCQKPCLGSFLGQRRCRSFRERKSISSGTESSQEAVRSSRQVSSLQ